MNNDEIYDVAVVGGGPSGLSGTLYTSRANLKTVLIEREIPGGQLNNTETIENYLGTPNANAEELALTMHDQALQFGAKMVRKNIQSILKREDGVFELKTRKGTIEAKSVLLATGTKYKKLGIPGEEELDARGVSYCAICDGPFFTDKEIAVVGGGDAALEEADYLTQFGSTVHLIHRRDEFRAKPHLQERVKNNPKITIHYNRTIESVNGENNVESLTLCEKDGPLDSIENLPVSAVFIYIGQLPQVLSVHEAGSQQAWVMNDFISVDNNMETSIKGLFAAGDIVDKPIRQVANAVGEGAVAAQYIYQHVQNFPELILMKV